MYTKLSASSPVHLPDGVTVDVGLCQVSTQDCHLLTPKSEMDHYLVRVDSHAYGLRYAQLYLSFNTLNMSFEYAVSLNDTLHVRVSTVGKAIELCQLYNRAKPLCDDVVIVTHDGCSCDKSERLPCCLRSLLPRLKGHIGRMAPAGCGQVKP